jgi:hypothetical protein
VERWLMGEREDLEYGMEKRSPLIINFPLN